MFHRSNLVAVSWISRFMLASLRWQLTLQWKRMLLTIGSPRVVLPSMSRLVVVIRSLTLVLLSALVIIVEATWQAPLSTPADRAVFSVNSTGADESEFPDETPTSPLRLRVFGKAPPQPKIIRPASVRSLRILLLRTQSHRSSHEDLFRRAAVLRI